MSPPRYDFARLTAAELPLIRRWLGEPHVAAWWPGVERELAKIAAAIDLDRIDPFLVSLAGRPIAYLQCYDPRGSDIAALRREVPGTRGIDQFIGEADMVGRGHGSALIRQFVDELLADAAVPAVITDPDPANARAIRAYEKAGFARVGPRAMPWGEMLLMRRGRGAAGLRLAS